MDLSTISSQNDLFKNIDGRESIVWVVDTSLHDGLPSSRLFVICWSRNL